MESKIRETLQNLVAHRDSQTVEQAARQLLNMVQDASSQREFAKALLELDVSKEQGSENIVEVFQEKNLSALIFFQTLSNSIIKNSENVAVLIQAFKKLEESQSQGCDGRFLGFIRSCLTSTFGINLGSDEKSSVTFSSSEELKRIEIDEAERAIFDNGSGFNPRLTRKEELITEQDWKDLKKGLLQENFSSGESSEVHDNKILFEFKSRKVGLNFFVNLINSVKNAPIEGYNLAQIGELIRKPNTVLNKLFRKCMIDSWDFSTQRILGLLGAELKSDEQDHQGDSRPLRCFTSEAVAEQSRIYEEWIYICLKLLLTEDELGLTLKYFVSILNDYTPEEIYQPVLQGIITTKAVNFLEFLFGLFQQTVEKKIYFSVIFEAKTEKIEQDEYYGFSDENKDRGNGIQIHMSDLDWIISEFDKLCDALFQKRVDAASFGGTSNPITREGVSSEEF